ncbi:MAG: HDOD domain-containing protein [Sulfuricella sp.]|nr:HDOD domain-containing protein [Sulfuricella sp.]
MTTMTPELERKLALAVEKMPAFPKSVQKILELTRNLDVQPKDLVQVIEKDPVMTVKILKVLNSAYFSLPNKITSINHSVVYLGFNTIKNLALSVAAVGIMPKQNAAGFDIQQYLLHSLTTASIAKQLCSQYAKGIDPTDCYIAGLLHDFGKVVFAQFLPGEFRNAMEKAQADQIPLHEAEKLMIGADHTVVGSMLAEKWQFPKQLVDSIRHHHSAENDETAIWSSVFAANQISKKLGFGNSGNPCIEALPPAAEQFFKNDLDGIIAELGDLSKIHEESKLFSQMEGNP